MVGIPVAIEYDDSWNGLTKNLVCRCGQWGPDRGETRTVPCIGETAFVASEVMKADMHLYLGVEGYSADGTLVMPTTWADCGRIQYGANAGADPAASPKHPFWTQLQVEIDQIKQAAATKEQIAAAVAAYLKENPVESSNSAGLTDKLKTALIHYYNHVLPNFDNAGGISYVNAILTALGAAARGDSSNDSGDDSGETEVTLTGISAAYSGGDVAVGTAVTALTGIVVTAHYSDGSSRTVTGYTLSGTIAEGSNTVTVTYQGKTATFTVTGVAASSGENNGWTDGAAYAIAWTDGYGISHSNDLGYEAGSAYEKSERSISDYLPCRGVDMVELSGVYANYGIFYYAADKTYLGRSETTSVVDANRVDVRRDAYYIRVQKATTSTASVTPHDLPVLDSATVWASGEYYALNWVDDKQVSTDTGADIDKAGGTCSDFAICYGASSIQFSSGSRNTIAWYDNGKQLVSTQTRQNNTTPVNIPDGVAYFRFVNGKANETNYWVKLS